MKASDIPARFPIPFANGAVAPYIHQVPTLSQIGIVDGAASLTTGFPPLNFTPIGAGGVPPFGNDVNGILFQATSWARWQAAAGPVPWDSAFSTAAGGYPTGAIVASATTFGVYWRSSVDDNTTNPDTGGAGWTPFAPGQAPTFTRITAGSGNYNPQANAPSGFTCKRIRVRMCGGGASGGTSAAAGNNGTLTSFGAWTANPGIKGLIATISGAGGAAQAGGLGGTGGSNGTGSLINRLNGGSGADGPIILHNVGTLAAALTYGINAPGGINPFGGGPGKTPAPNTGAGSAGVGILAPTNGQQANLASGGGASEYVEFDMPVTAATIAYVIGTPGAAPSGGIAGAAGLILIEEIYE